MDIAYGKIVQENSICSGLSCASRCTRYVLRARDIEFNIRDLGRGRDLERVQGLTACFWLKYLKKLSLGRLILLVVSSIACSVILMADN